MKRFKTILWDVDNTLLDFDKSAFIAMNETAKNEESISYKFSGCHSSPKKNLWLGISIDSITLSKETLLTRYSVSKIIFSPKEWIPIGASFEKSRT